MPLKEIALNEGLKRQSQIAEGKWCCWWASLNAVGTRASTVSDQGGSHSSCRRVDLVSDYSNIADYTWLIEPTMHFPAQKCAFFVDNTRSRKLVIILVHLIWCLPSCLFMNFNVSELASWSFYLQSHFVLLYFSEELTAWWKARIFTRSQFLSRLHNRSGSSVRVQTGSSWFEFWQGCVMLSFVWSSSQLSYFVLLE